MRRHDNFNLNPLSSASWKLDSVEVVNLENTSSFVFPCNKWLSKKHDDKQTTRELLCLDSTITSYSSDYLITVITDKKGPEARCKVLMKLVGDKHKSDPLEFAPGDGRLAAGVTDKFERKIRVLGEVGEYRYAACRTSLCNVAQAAHRCAKKQMCRGGETAALFTHLLEPRDFTVEQGDGEA